MKKILALLLTAALALGTLAGCKGDDEGSSKEESKSSETSNQGGDVVAQGEVKTGLAVVSSIASSKDAGEADGVGQIDSTIVAVTVDGDGKIVNCIIDAAQTKINFSAAGKITTALNSEVKTKNELGDDYNMKKNSGIGKEWYEQAAALAQYVKGKTIEEVKGISVNDKGAPADEDLAASVTVSIGGYVSAIEKAVANAAANGAKSDDKLGLGVVTTIDKSADAGEKDGKAQAYSTYAVVTTDADGKITSCTIDASQSDVTFSAEGKVTSDLTATLKTKDELGDEYGMKGSSDIGKEWYEQAASFAQYVVGKTADEVKGITVNEEGKTTDEELSASVTVSVGGFIDVVEKAAANAK